MDQRMTDRENRMERYFELMKKYPEHFRQDESLEIVIDLGILLHYQQENMVELGVVYESKYHIFLVDLVKNRNGEFFRYERIIQPVSGGAVIIPVFQGKLVLLHQFRHALRDREYAFPRGFGEPGKSAYELAQQELSEELGSTVKKLEKIGELTSDSGLCSDKIQVFRADIESVTLKQDYEGIEEIVLLDQETLSNWIRTGKITDGYTLAAFLFYSLTCE